MLKPTLIGAGAGARGAAATRIDIATAVRHIDPARLLAKYPVMTSSLFWRGSGARSFQIEADRRPYRLTQRIFLLERAKPCVLMFSFHHFVARHDAPEIGGRRVLHPHFRALRTVAMPRPRLEIAELLVHTVELGEYFGDQAVGRAVIGKQIVADAVPPRSPQQLVAI